MTSEFVRRAIFALIATLGLCALAIWVYEPDLISQARTVSDRMEQKYWTVEEVREYAVDPSREPGEKLGALRFLSGREDSEGKNGRTPEVVAVMTELFASTTDNGARADILAHLAGVDAPVLLPTLLEALRTDEWYETRESAAHALRYYVNTAGVRAALTQARDHDTDARVKGMAGWILDDN